MNRTELHATPQFHPGSLLAAVVYLRANMPRKRGGDATERISIEGYMNGFLDAIEVLETVAKPEAPKGEKKTYQPYSQPGSPHPQPLQTENPNQK